MTVEEIIKEHLKDNGYDGLYCPDAECGCTLEDLRPCCEDISLCRPGYRQICVRRKSDDCIGELKNNKCDDEECDQ